LQNKVAATTLSLIAYGLANILSSRRSDEASLPDFSKVSLCECHYKTFAEIAVGKMLAKCGCNKNQ
jgi:hypothetical protein